ncbi:MAG: putative Rmd1/YagE family protein [Lentisphaeria bacterium]|jgi:uncharacterized Rmd1/YagE family protein
MSYKTDRVIVTAVGQRFEKDTVLSSWAKTHKCSRYNDVVYIQQKYRHSSMFEWLIIILIAIVLATLPEVFR